MCDVAWTLQKINEAIFYVSHLTRFYINLSSVIKQINDTFDNVYKNMQ